MQTTRRNCLFDVGALNAPEWTRCAMSIYDDLGVRPVINADATLTKLGGSVMPSEVIAAMEDAARFHVDLEELHDCVGERLAALTGNEAAMVTTGAAAGILLAVAACASQAATTHTDTLDKNEVIMFTSHRNGYGFAVRRTGVNVIEIGGETHTEFNCGASLSLHHCLGSRPRR